MEVIGFAGKYHTLWICEKHVINTPYGREEYYDYCFVKNISFDRNTALLKYPNAKFDESLRGKTISFRTTPQVIYTNIDTFRFGKYMGQLIENTSDGDYLYWYYTAIGDPEHKEFIKNILISNFPYKEYNNDIVDIETYNILIAEDEIKNIIKSKVNNGETIDLTITHNPDSDGYIRVDGVLYKFPEVKESWYNGFPYYLPVLNGKAKRVKNKTIEISKCEYKDNVIYIYNYNIKK